MHANHRLVGAFLHGTTDEATAIGVTISERISNHTEYVETLALFGVIAATSYRTVFHAEMEGAFAVPQIDGLTQPQIVARQIIAATTNGDTALVTAPVSAIGPFTHGGHAEVILAHVAATARTFHQAVCTEHDR